MSPEKHKDRHAELAGSSGIGLPEDVKRLAQRGFNACWVGEEAALDKFNSCLLDPFSETNSRQGQCNALSALQQIIDTFMEDPKDPEYQCGLTRALECTKSVLFCGFDLSANPTTELTDLESSLVRIIQHEQFLPSKVLDSEDDIPLKIAEAAVSCLLVCLEHTSEQELSSAKHSTALHTLIIETIQAASEKVKAYSLDNELTATDEYQMSLIRNCADMAVYFPSRDLAAPLLALARASAELAQESHLFFPDAETPEAEEYFDEEYEDGYDDNRGDESEEPSGEFKTIAEACFSALVHCQDGQNLSQVWKHMLDNSGLDLEESEWQSALLGLVRIYPEAIELYLPELFDIILDVDEDQIRTQERQEAATHLILKLLVYEPSIPEQVRPAFDRLPPADKLLIARAFNEALTRVDTVMSRYSERQRKLLKEQVVSVFGLSNSQ